MLLTTTIAIIYAAGCTADQENINGHWHNVTPDIGSFQTLDIGDSLTTMNRFEIDVFKPSTCLRKDPKTSKYFLPFQWEEYTEVYSMDGDTLKITMNGFSYRYLKSDITHCELIDRYSKSAIEISIPESKSADDYDKLGPRANLILGRSVKEKYKAQTQQSGDSVFIQAGDIFVVLSDIPQYSERIKDYFSISESPRLVIHADKKVNEEFISQLVEMIPPTVTVYKAVNKSGQLGVLKISRN